MFVSNEEFAERIEILREMVWPGMVQHEINMALDEAERLFNEGVPDV